MFKWISWSCTCWQTLNFRMYLMRPSRFSLLMFFLCFSNYFHAVFNSSSVTRKLPKFYSSAVSSGIILAQTSNPISNARRNNGGDVSAVVFQSIVSMQSVAWKLILGDRKHFTDFVSEAYFLTFIIFLKHNSMFFFLSSTIRIRGKFSGWTKNTFLLIKKSVTLNNFSGRNLVVI